MYIATLSRFLVVGAMLVIAGCAGAPAQPPHAAASSAAIAAPPADAQARLRPCQQFFAELDRVVRRAKVTDSQAAPVPGFPYLRIDRFLHSFRDQAVAEPAFSAWVDRLQRLAEQGRQLELANLPADWVQALQEKFSAARGNPQDLMEMVRDCGAQLRRRDLADNARRERLRAAWVPSEYVTWKRAVGLYMFTALPVNSAIKKWHKAARATFAQPIESLAVHGELLRYVPPRFPIPLDSDVVRDILQRSAQNPLGIPEPEGVDRERLFATFAPTWQIDVVSDDDRLGAPGWTSIADERPTIDVRYPTVYRQLSHTRLARKVLLQLNYVVWFPARPRTSRWDYLGGYVDGITWRVTLSPDGTPLVFEAMHNCGCYHMFFPTPGLRLRPVPNTPDDDLQEAALVPQQVPALAPGSGPVLRIAHRTHYLQRVTTTALDNGRPVMYRWADYDSLRSLPLTPRGRRSLFRADGIVPGTTRGERWFLWPMGIPHPGQMRQWGHHATAFVGRRHFDDPYLLETTFQIDN
ncbi:MAG: hypothetical protein ACE5H7_16740 [Acidiferrobacterales bacterium]